MEHRIIEAPGFRRQLVSIVVLICATARLGAIAYAADPAGQSAKDSDTQATKDSNPHAAAKDARPIPNVSFIVQLVRDRAVQKALKVNADQSRGIETLVAEVDYPLFLLRDLPNGDSRVKLETIADNVEGSLRKLLTEPQRTRLGEIVLQGQGLPALTQPHLVEALKLSDSQVDKIRELLAESQKSNSTASDKSSSKGDSTSEHQTSFEERIALVLTAEQRSKLRRLAGQPFDLSKVQQVACLAPELRDVERWFNSKPLTFEELRGQVIAVHFWAFSCVNCARNLPSYKAWHEQYGKRGLAVVGIHTPETSRERVVSNLEREIAAKEIAYPVAVDSKTSNWAAWANRWWPSVYLVDKRGYVRYWWYGELNWKGARGDEIARKRIEELLAE